MCWVLVEEKSCPSSRVSLLVIFIIRRCNLGRSEQESARQCATEREILISVSSGLAWALGTQLIYKHVCPCVCVYYKINIRNYIYVYPEFSTPSRRKLINQKQGKEFKGDPILLILLICSWFTSMRSVVIFAGSSCTWGVRINQLSDEGSG